MSNPQIQIKSLCMHPSSAAERNRFSRRVRSGTLVRPVRSLYAPTDEWEKLDAVERARHIAVALAELHPAWVFSLFTAAALYGLEIGRNYAMPLHVQVPRGSCTRDTAEITHHPLTCKNSATVGAVMIEQGFMIPELQVKIGDPLDPSGSYYVDFRWRLSSGDVIGELDGKDKYVLPEMTGGRETIDVVIDERHRESRLTVPGSKVMRFSFRDVLDEGRFVSLLELYGIPRGPARKVSE